MKIKVLLLLAALMLSSALSAETVSETRALSVAKKFFYGNGAVPASTFELVWNGETVRTKADDSAPAFYVYARSGGGFVIVAGDDSVTPVLGYSRDGEFKTEGMPDNVSWWFAQLRDYIKEGIAMGLGATDKTKAEWGNLDSIGDTATEVVYIQTPSWNQGSPYNNLCPLDGSYSTYTGCVATAMAEILRTIRYPSAGTGTIPAYKTYSKSISIPAHTLGETYNWDQMPMTYSSSWTETQKNQVARLMYDCGTAVEMDYTSSGSGAISSEVPAALKTYFKIDSGATYKEASSYSSSWEQMLKNQLNTGYPLFYRGRTSDSGHAFVVDGYDSDGKFHVNFGWGGSSNAYLAYPNFNGGGYSFTQSHAAVFGIKPGQEEPEPEPEKDGEMYFKRSSSSDAGLAASQSDFVTGEKFTITAKGLLCNAGEGKFSGQVGIARVNSSGTFQEIISSTKTYSKLAPGSGDTNLSFSCSLTKLNGGDRAKLFSKLDGSSKWTEIECSSESGFSTSVYLEPRIDLPSNTSLSFDKTSRVLSVSTLAEATFSMKGPSGAVQYEKTGGNITVKTAGLPSGTYTISIVYRSQSQTLTIKL